MGEALNNHCKNQVDFFKEDNNGECIWTELGFVERLPFFFFFCFFFFFFLFFFFLFCKAKTKGIFEFKQKCRRKENYVFGLLIVKQFVRGKSLNEE